MERILGNEKQFSNGVLDQDDVHHSLCPPVICSSRLWSQDTRVYLWSARSTLAMTEERGAKSAVCSWVPFLSSPLATW